MVHRDVKPGSLFLCRVGKRTDFVNLLDFGLVKALYTFGSKGRSVQRDQSGHFGSAREGRRQSSV
jgi:hypothetical protein